MDIRNAFVATFDSLVAEYVSDLKHNDISEKTLENYQKRLGYFREFWSATDPQSSPTTSDVRAWRDSMLDSKLSKSTVRQYMVELNGFFEFATDEEIAGANAYKSNPISKRLYPRKTNDEKKPYEKVLDADDLKSLWQNIKKKGTDRLWARNYAIVTLLLDGKIRNAELLELRLEDIHFSDEDDPYDYLVVRKGKGKKYREVDLNEISVSALKIYLKSGIRPASAADDDYLFGTTAEHKFGGTSIGNSEWHKGSTAWLSKLVEKHVKDVTGKSGFRTHSMRHNGSIMELNNGASLETLQSELGHSSITTTELYAGRLQSKRNRMKIKEVIAERDKWAEINNEMLANA